jgi:hypothetical protein
MTDGGAAAAAGAAAVAQAIKASGVLVRLEPEEFMKVLAKQEAPLVVCASGGLLSTSYQYLVGYKGLAFYTKSHEALPLPSRAEAVLAKSISIPG